MQDNDSFAELIRHVEDADHNDPHDSLVRQVVRSRARDICEYCLLPTMSQFQIDHVIPAVVWPDYTSEHFGATLVPVPNRRGPDHLDNFAWACPFCNVAKRQHVTYRIGRHTLRLFDPRYDMWTEHFAFMNHYLFIIGRTPIGVATQRALGFNVGEISGPLGTRHDSILDGHYPPPWIASHAP